VDSGNIKNYKEVQIHGALQFSRDVEVVCIHSRHRSDKKMIEMCERFAAQNGIQLVWMEP
jgi:hypothetical protein